MTIIKPAAAHGISRGRMRVTPGRVSPTAASTSARPMKMRNAGEIDAFINSTMLAGGARKNQPCARKARASRL